MAFETLKQVVDDMATDTSMFDVNEIILRRHRKMAQTPAD